MTNQIKAFVISAAATGFLASCATTPTQSAQDIPNLDASTLNLVQKVIHHDVVAVSCTQDKTPMAYIAHIEFSVIGDADDKLGYQWTSAITRKVSKSYFSSVVQVASYKGESLRTEKLKASNTYDHFYLSENQITEMVEQFEGVTATYRHPLSSDIDIRLGFQEACNVDEIECVMECPDQSSMKSANLNNSPGAQNFWLVRHAQLG